ncbi:MAG: AAA family ATPase, partial [Myxococcales bacterium]|nr:AAA family ATPase [Myxococcales bacterium]
MIDSIEALLPYVPPPVVRSLLDDPERWFDPVETRFVGAALVIDMGWCPLLHGELPRTGLDEPDAVKELLDERLSRLIGACAREGGEVVRLAGGCFVAVFDPARVPGAPVELATVVRRAARAGETACALIATLPESHGRARVAVGAGEVVTCEVGGIYERWNYVVAGAALQEALAALAGAVEERPRVALGERADALLEQPAAPGPDEPVAVTLPKLSELPEALDLEALEDAVRRFVPTPVNDWLQHGLREWLTVLQPMSVLWIRVRGFAYEREGVAGPLHNFVRELQELIVERDGVVGELTVDEEGTLLWALFGVPPMSRQDDSLRAVRCALAIQSAIASEAWQEAGLGGTLGVATGAVFAGPVGTSARREYAVAGRGVRRARNLMLMARDGEILCDGETYRQIRNRVACDVLPATQLDGAEDEEVAVYRPYRQLPSQPRVREVIVGRMTERVFFAERLGQLQRGAGGGAILVEGEAGIGKSRLVKDLLRQAEVVGVRTLSGSADALRQTTAYQAWREVFAALLGVAGLKTPQRRRARVIGQLQEIADYLGQAGGPAPEVVGHAPLLNDVVALDFPENELTAQMSGAVRASNTRLLLRRLLEMSVLRGYRVVVLEDAHWFDSSSWSLALDVVRHVRPILLVLSTRPIGEPNLDVGTGAFAQLQTMPGTRALQLGPVGDEEIRTMVCRRLGVEQLPPPVDALLTQRAAGHPMFAEELAYALRDEGVIEVRGGECQVVEGARLEAETLPKSLRELIARRVETLSPSHQLTLKTASVIGRVFSLDALREVHPVASDKPHLLGQLATLAALDITPLETPDPDRSYRFKHTITREVVYGLMQPAQRQQVHTAVAEWLESRYADARAPIYPLLVHHWQAAADVWRTIIYLESAGEQALERGAYQEAIRFLGELLELTSPARGVRRQRFAPGFGERRAVEVDAPRRARWERMLGRAQLGLGDTVEGRRRLERSLEVLGYPVPRSRGGRALGLMRQGIKQLRRRALAPRGLTSARRRGASRETLLDAARTYADLVMIDARAGERESVPYSALMSINLSEEAGGSTSVLIEGYAMMSVLAAGLGWRGVAEAYARRAEDGARATTDLACRGGALLTLGLYKLGEARWDAAGEMLDASIRARERLGDQRLGDSLSVSACMMFLR